MGESQKWIKVTQAARMLGVSRQTVTRMVEDGVIPGRRCNRSVIVPANIVDYLPEVEVIK